MTCGLLTSPNSGQKQKLEALWQGATKTTVCAVFLNIRQMTKSLPKANCVKHAEPGALDVHPKTPKGHKATPRLLGPSAWTFTFRFHSRWYNGHRHTSSLNFDWGRFTKRPFQLMNHFQVYAARWCRQHRRTFTWSVKGCGRAGLYHCTHIICPLAGLRNP